MTNIESLIAAIHDDYATRYPTTDQTTNAALCDDLANALAPLTEMLAQTYRYPSDSFIDTANAIIHILNNLNRIAYLDDLCMLDEHECIRTFIDRDFIESAFNMNLDDSAFRAARFFEPIFNRESEIDRALYPELY